jgi:hypothetical protein
MIQQSPWVGVGVGNYLANLPKFLKNNYIFWLQPVHNIFLLLVSEVGILGLMGVIALLVKKIKWENLDKWSWILLGVIFLSGMVDHYWVTLPQYVVIVFDVGINLEPIFPLPPSLTRRGILFFNPSKMGWGLKIKISFRIEYTYVEKVDLEYFSAGIG